jgi:hypothetical protein
MSSWDCISVGSGNLYARITPAWSHLRELIEDCAPSGVFRLAPVRARSSCVELARNWSGPAAMLALMSFFRVHELMHNARRYFRLQMGKEQNLINKMSL